MSSKTKCTKCGYEFDSAAGNKCPRCGAIAASACTSCSGNCLKCSINKK